MPRSPSKTPSRQRVAAERRGHLGEALALWFLLARFYRLRDRRYKTPLGEIDLVVEKAGIIVFVEVKLRARTADDHQTHAAVNRARITRAAQFWQSRHPADLGKDYRFDVILLAQGRWPRHLINAFSAA